jgi:putative transposase
MQCHAGCMSNYRRAWVPGGTYFFTVNLLERRRCLLVENVNMLREAFRDARRARLFEIIAIVILPDHLHCIWKLPEGDANNSLRWSQIKSGFTRRLEINEFRSSVRRKKRERGIWQRRFWEHLIKDEEDFNHHINYVYINPVKHGHVARVVDWPYSSFHRDVRRGIYDENWAG